jgi:cation-transporting ATPase I
VVVLGAGDIVPADARLLEANHLFVDESSLTGESAASLKNPMPGNLDPDKDDDRAGLAFFGTSVVSGTGTAVVTATGAGRATGRSPTGWPNAPPRPTSSTASAPSAS